MASTSCRRWADDDGVVSGGTLDAVVEHFGVPPELQLVLLGQLYAMGLTVSGVATRVLLLQPLTRAPFKAYAHPILGAERERVLVARVAEGSAAASRLDLDDGLTGFDKRRLSELVDTGARAKRELVAHNLRLVAQLARRLRRHAAPFLEVDELISEGIAGLMHAIDKFDVERGFRLSTYATWWIRQAMHRAIANQRSHIRIPVHAQEDMRNISLLETDRPIGSRRLTDAEVASAIDVPIPAVTTLRRAMEPIESYEYVRATFFTDAGSTDGTDDLLDRLVVEAAMAELRIRDETAHRVILERFGFVTGGGQTLQEVGDRMALTRERIRQIQNRGLDQLREILDVQPPTDDNDEDSAPIDER